MKILLAIDGSSHSSQAAEVLGRIAHGAHEVTVLNVTPPSIPAPEKGLQSVTEALKESAVGMTAAVAAQLGRRRSLKARAAVAESTDVAGTILGRAEKEKAGLIVLGARGLGPLKAFFLGSVSQKVLGHAEVPVLIVRRGLAAERPRIVAAVDGSPGSRRALAFFRKLRPPRRTRVTLLHTMADPLAGWAPGPYGMATDAAYISPEAYNKARAALKRRGRLALERALRGFRGWRPRVETAMPEGFPANEIIQGARARSADLIVIGRRGLSGLDRFPMGSVSQKVSAYAGCSVLVVR